MSRQHAKADTFNLRVDPALKAEFQAATQAEDKPAAQVLREFMRHYVERQKRREFAAEARRQAGAIAARAADPNSDDAAMLRELEGNLAGLVDEWK